MVMKFDSYGALMINRGNRILILFHSYCCSKNTLSPGGGVLNKCLYREALPRGPTPYPFIYHFFTKKYPFRIPSIDKWYPFHMPCLELCIPFSCCCSFK